MSFFPLGDPSSLSLDERQAQWHELVRLDAELVEVITHAQDARIFGGDLSVNLGLARNAILDQARAYWPEQSWESTNTGGPPQDGDLHVKVASVAVEPRLASSEGRSFVCPEGVALRIGISAIQANFETEQNTYSLGPEAAIFCPLDLAPMLVEALQEQIAYWVENPPA